MGKIITTGAWPRAYSNLTVIPSGIPLASQNRHILIPKGNGLVKFIESQEINESIILNR